MRIVHLAAGAGEMYCGACARDLALVKGLIARGHEVLVVPLYTPLRSDVPTDVPISRVHMGGITAYLQQVSGLFRRMPRIMERVLDSPPVLHIAAKFAVSTRAEDVGPMAVSVLDGLDGRQRLAVERLLEFLETQPRPDVITITNSLLSGVAPALRQRFGVPVVCGLTGEDGFVDAMRQPWRARVLERMQRNLAHVGLLVAPSDTYAATMAAYLGIDPARIRVVRPTPEPGPLQSPVTRLREPFTVGYLSSIAALKGLDLLVEAFRGVAQDVPGARLRIAGRVLRSPYWRQVRESIDRLGIGPRVDLLGEVDAEGKAAFWRSVSVVCVPARVAESRGMVALEAQAAGVPVAMPASGTFPEMMGLTGGGVVFDPCSPPSIAEALLRLAADPDAADAMGRRGWEGVTRHFSAAGSARAMEAVLDEAVAGRQ